MAGIAATLTDGSDGQQDLRQPMIDACGLWPRRRGELHLENQNESDC
jgi:hypothetical protein